MQILNLIKFLFHLCILFLMTSCASRFTEAEKQIISNYSKDKTLRIYKITDYKDSVLLRTKSTRINYRKDEKWVRELTDKMIATVKDSASMGVGIAAPQVGILKKIVIVQRFDKPDFPFEVYINPKITKYSKEKQECVEGCLSIPDFTAKMYIRSKNIDLKYKDINGKKHQENIKDFTAVIFQHEIDHLNGILFIDHLKDEAQYELQKID